MFLHHLASVFLISFSYVNNMARVGTLVLCLHDSADAFLEVKVSFIFKSTTSRTQEVPKIITSILCQTVLGTTVYDCSETAGYFLLAKFMKVRLN